VLAILASLLYQTREADRVRVRVADLEVNTGGMHLI
jgi:hypothetical protein